MIIPATRKIENTHVLNDVQDAAEKNKIRIKDCIDSYGNFVWALARKFTDSAEDAEKATREIFTDIWQYGECADDIQSLEDKIISRIAIRRLIKHSR